MPYRKNTILISSEEREAAYSEPRFTCSEEEVGGGGEKACPLI
jgi:hypothetical protein